MSESHPNRQKRARTRPGLTRRRLIECWPLLVWAGVLILSVIVYRGGSKFSRMNGAVDPYQENIAPSENGRLREIHVKRGQIVKPGDLIATMDSSVLEAQLTSLLRGVASDRDQDILRLEGRAADLKRERRELQLKQAEDTGKLEELRKVVSAVERGNGRGQVEVGSRTYNLASISGEILQRFKVDQAELEAGTNFVAGQLGEINRELGLVDDQLAKMRTLVDTLRAASTKELVAASLDGLQADEQREAAELQQLIRLCELRTTKGGRVSRLEKEPGEPVLRAEGITKVIADPQEIVAFLPQEEVGNLKVGDQVWVTASRDPGNTNAYRTQVDSVSPRIDAVLDAASPLPNQRIWGREIAMAYPEDAKPKFEGDTFKLLPGQTVTVHTTPPGEIPLLDRIFPNHDRPGE